MKIFIRVFLAIVFFAILGLVLMALRAHGDEEFPPPKRFERISREKAYGVVDSFIVYHDKVSGQEFTCAVASDAIGWSLGSCFPTGRNWK